jgi:ribonuclease E
VASAPHGTDEHSEKTPRRSTVREKVGFLSTPQPEAAPAPVTTSEAEPQPAPVEEAPQPAQTAEPAAETSQPRRAGWWSRRFGSRE